MYYNPNRRKRFYKAVTHPSLWRTLFFLALIGSYTLSVLSGETVAPLFFWSDKLNHAIAFLVLAFLMRMGWKVDYLKVVALLILYGAFIEFSQLFAIHRSAELADVVADTVGIFIGLKLFKWLRLR